MFNRYPLAIHYAAGDGGGAGEPAGNTDPNPNPGSNDPANEPKKDDPPKTPSFSELLKTDKGFQSEFDKRVDTALKTAKAKWDDEQKLSADDLAKKKHAEAEDALKSREAALATRELKADMVTEIGKRGLPAALIGAVSLTDQDTAQESLDNVEKAFRAAVDAEVAQKLKGNAPQAGGGGGGDTFAEKLRAAAGVKQKG